jgi:nucleotide-binding universal stress UspA family protein
MVSKPGKLKILLAVDDSTCSQAAIDLLKQISPAGGSEVRLIHVVEPLDRAFYPELTAAFPTSLAEVQRARVADGRKILERAAKQVSAAGYRTSSKLGRGHIRSTIVEAAESWKASLIVLGSHGRTGLKRVLLGSVSDHVARHAHCSVLIVRPKAR